jgi:hypothetical protein
VIHFPVNIAVSEKPVGLFDKSGEVIRTPGPLAHDAGFCGYEVKN